MNKQESTRLKVEPLESRVMMAFDTYLKIEGCPGEATVRGKVGYVDIESFSWGTSNLPPPPGGTPSTSSQNLVITKTLDKATPLLAKACATGQHIKKAMLFVRKQGGDQHEYMKVTLSDILISGYQVSGQGQSDRPMESLSMNFTKITFEYTKQKPERANKRAAFDVVKVTDPPLDARGLDLNGDGTPDPLFFAYVNLRDINRDLIVDFPIPNDGDNNGQLDMPLLVDLDGDGQADQVNGAIDSDGDGTVDMVLPVDVDGAGPPDMPLPVDNDHDGYVDDLILIDLNGDGTADMLGGYYCGHTDHL